MSKKIKAILVCAALMMSGALMSFTSSNPTSAFPVPKPLEEKVIGMAVRHGYLSTSEGQMLTDNHAIQQCVDAFVSSGYEPSVAVDKMAEIGVSSGKFQTKAEAKQAIKKTVEKARKKEANWKKFYRILGL